MNGAFLYQQYQPDPDPERDFPTLTHVIMLKDTWSGIIEQMHELGLTAVVRLFKINYNLRYIWYQIFSGLKKSP